MSTAHVESRAPKRSRAQRLFLTYAGLAMMATGVALEPVFGDGVIVLLGLGACVAMVGWTLWFVARDEVVQRAHYVAWFWGGSFAYAAIAFAFLAALGLGAPLEAWMDGVATDLLGKSGFSTGVAVGVTLAGAAMFIGYAIWWAVFWLRRH